MLSSKTVLLITDEGLLIYTAGGGKAAFRRLVPWETQNFENVVSNMIQKDCGGKPVLILNDMVEQHYRKERVPKVGSLDKANVVRNRLAVAFPSYAIRAALPLNEKLKPQKEQAGPMSGGSVFLFAAVPMTEALNKTFEAVKKSFATISGFCLLPVESSTMAIKLSEKLISKPAIGGGRSHWTILIGQQRNGNLRQVVTRNKDLALTRLTPIVETDEDPNMWAAEVTQEFKATMSYLSRFGYTDQDQLDIILIGNRNATDKVGELLTVDCDFRGVTVHEASKILGLSLRNVDSQKNADYLHVAWATKKLQYTLPMKSARLDAVLAPRMAASAATILLTLSLTGLVAVGAYDASRYSTLNEQIDTKQNTLNAIDLKYSKEVDKKNKMGIDVELIQASLDVDEELEKQEFDPLELVKIVGEAVGPGLRIDNYNMELQEKLNRMGRPTGQKQIITTVDFSFPDEIKPQQGNAIIERMKRNLERRVDEGYKVSITKEVQDLSYTGVLTEKSGIALNDQQDNRDYKAQISITGDLQND